MSFLPAGKRLIVPVILLGLGPARPAQAGMLVGLSGKWGTFVARPNAEEPTPNYYGFGLGLSLGYSLAQIFDIAAYTHYIPARLSSAQLFAEDAQFLSWGGEVALRFSQSVYFALRGGGGRYKLVYQRQEDDGDEIPGTWKGPSGGISLGAIQVFDKQNFLQTSLDVMHTVVEDKSGELEGKRRFDTFSLSVTYVFNGYQSRLLANSIFKNFLGSIIF